MAKKPHKFEWNGVDIDTVLTPVDMMAICAQAAMESTGDLWQGKQRISESNRGDGWILYTVKSTDSRRAQLMTFLVEFDVEKGRTSFTTSIGEYTTVQEGSLAIIAVGHKKMVAHHTYLQFGHKVANSVGATDSSAVIRIREGIDTEGVSRESPAPSAAPVPAIPTAQAATPSLAAPADFVEYPGAPASSSTFPVAQPANAWPTTFPPPPPTPPLSPSAPMPADSFDDSVWFAPTVVVSGRGAVDEATQVVARRPRQAVGWELVFPDGNVVEVTSPVMIGRNPAAGDRVNAQLIRVPEGSQKVSKTHAVFELGDSGLTVTDLHSMNGTAVMGESGRATSCVAGIAVELAAGSEVELGGFAIVVRRSSHE